MRQRIKRQRVLPQRQLQRHEFRGRLVHQVQREFHLKHSAIGGFERRPRLAHFGHSRLKIDVPLNLHLTGCAHSCAQHYIGDLGFLATKVEVGDDFVEAYHVYAGGGSGATQGIATELARNILAEDLPEFTERLLTQYMSCRKSGEPFVEYARRLGAAGMISAQEKANVAAPSA